MRLNKLMAVAAALTLAVPAFAQFSNAGSKSVSSQDLCKSYNRIGVSYTNTGYTGHKYDFMEDENHLYLNGFAVEYIHGFSVSKSLPMFVETGVKANFGFGSLEGEEEEEYSISITPKLQVQDIYLAVPVNYAYKFGIGDNCAITPYLGLNFKLHLMSRLRTKIELDGADPDDLNLDDDDLTGDWVNLYSDDEDDGMGDKDATWNRFQLGWHIGVGFNYKHLYVGVNYGTDFINAFKYKKSSVSSGNLGITLGYSF
jgi:hypothetical protein